MIKDEKFEKLLEGIYQELLNANMHFRIFWTTYAAPSDIANIRNVYLTFFVFTMRSHNDRFCIAVHNVIKSNKHTSNFTKVFNYIKSNKNMQSIFSLREIEEMESTIKSHSCLIKRIAVIRNQYIAHNQLTKKHLKEDTNYKYEEGKALLIDLNSILQKISHKYGNKGYWVDNLNLLDVSPKLNLEDMLQDLTEHRNDQIKRTREIIKQTRTSHN